MTEEPTEFMSKVKYSKWVYTATLTATAVTITLIAAAPLAAKAGYDTLSQQIYYTFSKSCHQIPEKSLHLMGFKLAVCARCTGIYLGLLASTIIYPLARKLDETKTPRWRLMAITAAPLALDALTQFAGLRESSNAIRLATGLLFGTAVPFYLLPLINQAAERAMKRLDAGNRLLL